MGGFIAVSILRRPQRRGFGAARVRGAKEGVCCVWMGSEIDSRSGDRKTFERSKLKWDEVNEGEHAEMLEWYRQLIRLRRSSESLNRGDLEVRECGSIRAICCSPWSAAI